MSVLLNLFKYLLNGERKGAEKKYIFLCHTRVVRKGGGQREPKTHSTMLSTSLW